MTITRHARAGFTFIELVIAIAILAILAAIVGPMFMGQLEKARVSGTRSNLNSIKSAIGMFKVDTARYPNKLRDLVKKPRDEALARKWQKGGYLEGGELPDDAWGESFQYKRTPEGKNPYELYSYGPNLAGSPKEEWHSVWDKG